MTHMDAPTPLTPEVPHKTNAIVLASAVFGIVTALIFGVIMFNVATTPAIPPAPALQTSSAAAVQSSSSSSALPGWLLHIEKDHYFQRYKPEISWKESMKFTVEWMAMYPDRESVRTVPGILDVLFLEKIPPGEIPLVVAMNVTGTATDYGSVNFGFGLPARLQTSSGSTERFIAPIATLGGSNVESYSTVPYHYVFSVPQGTTSMQFFLGDVAAPLAVYAVDFARGSHEVLHQDVPVIKAIRHTYDIDNVRLTFLSMAKAKYVAHVNETLAENEFWVVLHVIGEEKEGLSSTTEWKKDIVVSTDLTRKLPIAKTILDVGVSETSFAPYERKDIMVLYRVKEHEFPLDADFGDGVEYRHLFWTTADIEE